MALPAAMNAGTSAAKGRSPPFCLFDVLLLPLHLFLLLRTMVSSCRLRVYWYNDDGWCVVFIGEGVIYNLNFLLAAIIFRDNFSMANFLPGSASMAWTIFRSAFHLSRMLLALEYSISCCLAILSKRLIPGSPRASRFLRNVPGPRYWYLLRFENEKGWNSIPNFSIFFCMSTFPPLCLLFFGLRAACCRFLAMILLLLLLFFGLRAACCRFLVMIGLLMLKRDRVLFIYSSVFDEIILRLIELILYAVASIPERGCVVM